jgi:FkbM family methyltransferase
MEEKMKYKARDRFEVKIQNHRIWLSIEDPYSKLWILQRFAGGKIHEKPVTLLLLDALKDSKCFVDCGANLGWYTCLASKLLPDGIVYGFEMDDLNYNLLRKNVSINNCKNVAIYCVAVTDTSGWVSYRRASMGPNPRNSLSSYVQDTEASEEISVEAISLDNFFRDKEVMPDLIKIDVEGAETKVLKGMKEIMKNNMPKLLIEVHPSHLLKMNSSKEEVLSILIKSGYEVLFIEELRKQSSSTKIRKLAKNSYLPDQGEVMLYACKDNQKSVVT